MCLGPLSSNTIYDDPNRVNDPYRHNANVQLAQENERTHIKLEMERLKYEERRHKRELAQTNKFDRREKLLNAYHKTDGSGLFLVVFFIIISVSSICIYAIATH